MILLLTPRSIGALLGYAFLALSVVGLTACGSAAARSVSTTSVPGNPIVEFPNSADQAWSTVISSQPFFTQAGIDGRTLTVSVYHGADHLMDDLTMDFDGDVGIRGVYRSVSTRKDKWDIRPYKDDALQLLRKLPISTFRYHGESGTGPPHVGFIAEDAPAILGGPRHDSFNLNNSIGISLAANKELNARVESLSARVVELERVVRELQRLSQDRTR
jgi:hypothetical protein